MSVYVFLHCNTYIYTSPHTHSPLPSPPLPPLSLFRSVSCFWGGGELQFSGIIRHVLKYLDAYYAHGYASPSPQRRGTYVCVHQYIFMHHKSVYINIFFIIIDNVCERVMSLIVSHMTVVNGIVGMKVVNGRVVVVGGVCVL